MRRTPQTRLPLQLQLLNKHLAAPSQQHRCINASREQKPWQTVRHFRLTWDGSSSKRRRQRQDVEGRTGRSAAMDKDMRVMWHSDSDPDSDVRQPTANCIMWQRICLWLLPGHLPCYPPRTPLSVACAALFCLSEIESANQADDVDDDSDGKLPVGHN